MRRQASSGETRYHASCFRLTKGITPDAPFKQRLYHFFMRSPPEARQNLTVLWVRVVPRAGQKCGNQSSSNPRLRPAWPPECGAPRDAPPKCSQAPYCQTRHLVRSIVVKPEFLERVSDRLARHWRDSNHIVPLDRTGLAHRNHDRVTRPGGSGSKLLGVETGHQHEWRVCAGQVPKCFRRLHDQAPSEDALRPLWREVLNHAVHPCDRLLPGFRPDGEGLATDVRKPAMHLG